MIAEKTTIHPHIFMGLFYLVQPGNWMNVTLLTEVRCICLCNLVGSWVFNIFYCTCVTWQTRKKIWKHRDIRELYANCRFFFHRNQQQQQFQQFFYFELKTNNRKKAKTENKTKQNEVARLSEGIRLSGECECVCWFHERF